MRHKGLFKPKNPQKYVGDPSNIRYLSSLEKNLMNFLDNSPSIVSWASEELTIPYLSPKDGKMHGYWPDFLVKRIKSDGTIEKVMIEVKPYEQTKPPTKGKKKSKYYTARVMVYAINQAKWEAAKIWCAKNGYKWLVMTEKDLAF